jgi:hypothetical protein
MTDRFVLFIEGKRTEPLAPATPGSPDYVTAVLGERPRAWSVSG